MGGEPFFQGRGGAGQPGAGHSEGKSLREGVKKRLGANIHPQNGDIRGYVASCVASEDYTIDHPWWCALLIQGKGGKLHSVFEGRRSQI